MAFLSFPSPTQLKNLANPTDNQDAVTLAYLDTALNGSGNIVVANVSANIVTSNNVTANTVTVNGIINLGPVGNVKIDGGTTGQVLSTDGTGNLSWINQASGGTALPGVVVDSFTGDGTTNSFQLTVTPASKALVFINVDGVFQIRDSFDLLGNAIIFGSVPLNGSLIEVSTFEVGASGGGSSGPSYTYVEVTANVTMLASRKYIVDTSSANITLTLPSSGTLGDEITVIDGTGNASAHAITIARNGGNIQGLSSDMTVTTERAAFTLAYYNATQGWLLTNV